MISHSYSFLSPETRQELEKVELYLNEEMSGGNSHISAEALRLLKGGGKRIRPLMTILFSMLGDEYDSRQAILTGSALETLHMATLIHDDTIDNAEQRRGVETTFKKHGIHTAVYTGDWMFVKALKMLSGANEGSSIKSELLDYLAEAMEAVCSGEINQYYGRGKIPSEKEYFSRIKDKTAALFAAACIFGAKNSGLSDKQSRISLDFGYSFGIAFQIQDDILDIKASSEAAGKPVLNDLREGIITLPVLLATEKSRTFRKKVADFLEDPESNSSFRIHEETISLGGIDLASAEAKKYLKKCRKFLDLLPESKVIHEINLLLDNIFVYI